jgi:hypothetical protein
MALRLRQDTCAKPSLADRPRFSYAFPTNKNSNKE